MILELQEEQPYTNLKTWLEIAGLPRSSYYEWKAKLREPSKKDCEVIETMTKIVHASKYRYGYDVSPWLWRTKVLTLSTRNVLWRKLCEYRRFEREDKEYIHGYNTKRIKTKLNGMSPVEYRLHSVMNNSCMSGFNVFYSPGGFEILLNLTDSG